MRYYPVRYYNDYGYGIRRRHIDRKAFAIRHNDGLKDLFGKLKQKVSEAIDRLRAIPTSKKLAMLLTTAVAVVGGIFAAKNKEEITKRTQKIEELKKAIEESAKQLYNSTPVEELKYGSSEEYVSAVSAKSAPLIKRRQEDIKEGKFLIKTIVGILGMIVGAAGTILVAKS